jgi:hypothetical protein
MPARHDLRGMGIGAAIRTSMHSPGSNTKAPGGTVSCWHGQSKVL